MNHQEKYPDCEAKTVYRLAPVGRKGYTKLEARCKIMRGEQYLAEDKTEKRA